MKRVLIISPYFPPTNAADMQRVRMSLPFFREFGWEPEIVTVDLTYTDMVRDPLLTESIPSDVPVHYVGALPKKLTSKFGLGNVALRSLFHYRKKVNQLLATKRFDLIYFSTTQFAVCVLGAYWWRRFQIPYVIDMQDPWLSEFNLNQPKSKRPPKYWLANQLSKKLEPIAMRRVGGLIAVSDAYLQTLATRYANCRTVPQRTITFGAFEKDFAIARANYTSQPPVVSPSNDKINVVYVGRGGEDMEYAVGLLFQVFRDCLRANRQEFEKFHFYFIGTSYAAKGRGVATIAPVAQRIGIGDFVTEITDRVPFYQTLNTLSAASALFVPGSLDPQYTASKIYPYVLAKKPLLALFHPESSVVGFLKNCGTGTVVTFNQDYPAIENAVTHFFVGLLKNGTASADPDPVVINEFSSRMMTRKQCELFDAVCL